MKMANRKIRPGHCIAQMLLSGEPVTKSAIEDMFLANPVLAPTLYKIPGYVGDIRKYDQGVVKVVKDGRKVVSYQLLNFREFDQNGQRLTGEALTAIQAAMDATKPVAEVVNPYSSTEIPEQTDEVVTEETAPETPAEEVVTATETSEPSAEEVVTEPTTEETPAVTEPVAEAPAKPKRNRKGFAQKAA